VPLGANPFGEGPGVGRPARPPGMLLINNAQVAELLTMADWIGAQEAAFRKLPSGGAIHRGRVDMYFPCEREDAYFRWGTMEGANGQYFAIRMKSDIVSWPKDAAGNMTEDKYCVQPGTYCGLIMLMSTRDGEPLAFINDGVLQHMRVGAGAGLGVKYLAREDAHVVGMLGSGGMARTFLEAFCSVRDIKACRVYSPTAANREAFAAEMTARLGIDVRAVGTAREAVRGADILSSCTDAMSAVYDAEWLEPGMHVTNLGFHELPPAAFARFDVAIRQGDVALDLVEGERVQTGIGHSPVAFIGGTAEEMRRLPRKADADGIMVDSEAAAARRRGRVLPTFADLASGAATGRTSRDQVTFYRNNGNQGLQFSAVGGWVYAEARKRKVGREIPTEWFLQDVRD
jgi:alanine dehydrogenase